jgi:HAD superfamily hydrolase (TIGR01509 family)
VLRAVLFDFNGVLVDDEPLHLELFQRVLAEEGLALAEADYYARYLGFDDRGCFAAVLTAAGEPAAPPRLARLIARKASYYREEIHRRGYPFFAGALELVAAAAARGWMLGVVSGALRDEVEGALRQAALRDRFKVLVTAEDVTAGKPDPESYRLALAALNSQPPLPARLIHPHETIAVEDSPAGLESAAGAGLLTLGVAHTYPPSRLAAATAVVESVAGVTVELLAEVAGGVS